MALTDAGNSFQNKDYDASAAHVAGGGVGLMAVLIGGAALWPLLLLSIGFVMLALYFTDNEIEHYFKFFALSNQLKPDLPIIPNTYAAAISTARKPAPTLTSHQVIRNLCANMKNVCSYGKDDQRITPNNEDQTFEMHYIKLMDFLCPAKFTLRTIAKEFTSVTFDTYEPRGYATPTWTSRTAKIAPVSKLRLEIDIPSSSLGANQVKDLVELKIYVRLSQGAFVSVPLQDMALSIKRSEHNQASSTAQLNIPLPSTITPQIGANSFYVLFRLDTPSGYMPLPYRGTARYFTLPVKGFQLLKDSITDDSDEASWLYEVKSQVTLYGSPIRVASITEFTSKDAKVSETGEHFQIFRNAVTALLHCKSSR